MIEHTVFAGAQLEHFLQQMNAVAHRHAARKGPEVTGTFGETAPVKRQPRKAMRRQRDVGVGLVVPKQDVVARRQRFDQVVFKDQRLGLGACGGEFHLHDLRHHHGNPRAGQLVTEIGRKTLFEILGLADIQHLCPLADHPVDPGIGRRVAQKGLVIEARHVNVAQARRVCSAKAASCAFACR